MCCFSSEVKFTWFLSLVMDYIVFFNAQICKTLELTMGVLLFFTVSVFLNNALLEYGMLVLTNSTD